MNIAVTAMGDSLESEVDQRFGRAHRFVVVDDESNLIRVIDNSSSVDLPSGAGVQTSSRLVEAGVKAVLTGHCGPRAFQVMDAAGIEIYIGASGTVADAVARYRRGELAKANSPDVAGHWF